MRVRETVYAMMDRVAQIPDKQDRRDALRELCHEKRIIAMIIQYAYHPDVQWDLPKGDLPEKLFIRSSHDDYSVFYQCVKKLKNFWVGSPVKRLTKEQNFIGLCSDVAGKDADLLISMKDKKLPWKTLNKSFCVKALPELFPPSVVEQTENEKEELVEV